jgi:hypothetical protein
MEAEERKVITIDDEQLRWVKDHLADLEKRAAKMGVVAPRLEIVASRVEEVVTNREFGIKANQWFHDVILHEAVVMFDGWKFVACIDHTTGVIRAAGTAPEGIVRMYQEAQPVCDHCGRKMARSKTIIVEHEDGTRKQVGSSCMKQFIVGFPSLSSALFRFLDDAMFDEDEMPLGSGITLESTDPRSFLAVANAVVRALGWSPASFDDRATKAIVADLMFGKPSKDDREQLYRDVQVGESDYAAADQLIVWVQDRPAESDFDLNLRAAALAPRVAKNAGILAFLPEAFRRETEGALVKAAAESGPVADCPNGRETVTGTVTGIKTVDTDYGTQYKMTVLDDRGFRVYGTAPSAFRFDAKFEVGCRVEFFAELIRSDNDATFGFYKRPSKPVLVGSERVRYELPRTESRDHDEDDI